MRPSIVVFVVTCLIATSAPLFAQQAKQKDYDAAYQSCAEKSGPINNGVVAGCSEMVSDDVKHEMNALYKVLHDKVMADNQDDVVEFEKAQKAWLTYRNGHCHLAGEYVGGPDEPYCEMKLNIERVSELRELAN